MEKDEMVNGMMYIIVNDAPLRQNMNLATTVMTIIVYIWVSV